MVPKHYYLLNFFLSSVSTQNQKIISRWSWSEVSAYQPHPVLLPLLPSSSQEIVSAPTFIEQKNCFFELNKNKLERCKFWHGSRRPIDFRSHVKTRKPWAHFRPPDLPSHLRDCIVIWLGHVGACAWQWRLPFQDCIARSLALADQRLALACFWQMLDPFYTSSLHSSGWKTNSPKKNSTSVPVWLINLILIKSNLTTSNQYIIQNIFFF